MSSDPEVKNISESGFNLPIPDGRMFENFIENNIVGKTSGNVIYEGNYRPTEEQANTLETGKYLVQAGETTLGATEVTEAGDYSLNFKHLSDVDINLPDKVEEKLSNATGLASSLQGYADAQNIRNLSFKELNTVQSTKENNTMKTDDIKDFAMSKKGVAVAVAGVIGFMVLR